MGRPALKIVIGNRYGRLQVIKRVDGPGKNAWWLCQCDCGKEATVTGSRLVNGTTKSCGCLQQEVRSTNNLSHGRTGTHLYRVWQNMITRCTNERVGSYKHYGARGISVCDEWRRFEIFANDMGPTYVPGLTLERIDVNGNYSKNNCTWASRIEQANNRRSNRYITYCGKLMTVAEVAHTVGMPVSILHHRLYDGWKLEDALSVPVKLMKKPSIRELIRQSGSQINEVTVRYRLKKGWAIEEALSIRPRGARESAPVGTNGRFR